MREKKRCELSVVVSLGGERGESLLSVAMTGWVMSERPPLAALWPKWSQIDLVWHHYDQSGPRKRWTWSGSNTFEMKSTLSGWNLFVCSLFMSFLAFRRNACLSGKVALASGSLALLLALASACSSWWAEQMECHAAVVCVSLRLIEQVLRSLWWVVEDEKRVSISPTLWERFSLLFW